MWITRYPNGSFRVEKSQGSEPYKVSGNKLRRLIKDFQPTITDQVTKKDITLLMKMRLRTIESHYMAYLQDDGRVYTINDRKRCTKQRALNKAAALNKPLAIYDKFLDKLEIIK